MDFIYQFFVYFTILLFIAYDQNNLLNFIK